MLLPYYQQEVLEAGCDEAGRGCYAGPVFAAAVILPAEFYHSKLNDSKQVAAPVREKLARYIQDHALAWAVASVPVADIDAINILNASFKAMHLALDALVKKPGLILVDGNRFKPYKHTPHFCIIKGDGLYASIAAASILAKTARDAYMQQLHVFFPQYHWAGNKGYGTKAHRDAIAQYGLTEYHRKSFNILPKQLSLL